MGRLLFFFVLSTTIIQLMLGANEDGERLMTNYEFLCTYFGVTTIILTFILIDSLVLFSLVSVGVMLLLFFWFSSDISIAFPLLLFLLILWGAFKERPKEYGLVEVKTVGTIGEGYCELHKSINKDLSRSSNYSEPYDTFAVTGWTLINREVIILNEEDFPAVLIRLEYPSYFSSQASIEYINERVESNGYILINGKKERIKYIKVWKE